MTATCDLCWATFPDEAELAKHVDMEETVGWPIDGLEYVYIDGKWCAFPSSKIADGGGGGVSQRPFCRPRQCDQRSDDAK